MALAPYFDKAALAAATVLKGFDRDAFASTLEQHVVGLAFDDTAADSVEARHTISLCVSLTARLYPTIAVMPIGERAAAVAACLGDDAKLVNPLIELASSEHVTVCIAVGRTPAADAGIAAATPTFYLGSSGWDALFSQRRPVGSGGTGLPFGAGAAACIGLANVFRQIFAMQLPSSGPDTEFALSTDTLRITRDLVNDGDTEPSPPTPSTWDPLGVDVGEVCLVGAGAVGEGSLWALARTLGVSGTIRVIDDQAIDAMNPQRYILTRASDVGEAKVAVAVRGFVGNPNLIAVPHQVRWGQFLAVRPQPWRLHRVLVALDSARDRIAVQAALPAWVANAWTQPGDLGLSTHRGLGLSTSGGARSACLACQYLPTGVVKNEDQMIGEALGLVGQEMLIRQLLMSGAPVGVALLEQIGVALGLTPDAILSLTAYADRPLRALYSEAVCGGVVLRLQASSARVPSPPSPGPQVATPVPVTGLPSDRGAAVPMAFQSAMAGILLGAALVAEVVGRAVPDGRKVVIDLLRPIGDHLTVPIAQHPSGRCLCQDPDYRLAYARVWDIESVKPPNEAQLST
ncbi:MAG: E2 ligase fold family C protein [Gemmatimonadaceae bacterium]